MKLLSLLIEQMSLGLLEKEVFTMHTVELISDIFSFSQCSDFKKMKARLKAYGKTESITLCQMLNKKDNTWYFKLNVDCLKMLEKQNTEKADYPKIIETIDEFLAGWGMSLHDFKVHRFDACVNFTIADRNEMDCLFSLLHFLPEKLHHVQREKPYPTSEYHKNKSRAYLIYDKEAERSNKGEEIMLHEEDIIRFEVHLKKDAVNYYKFRKGKSRSLDSWANPEWERELLLAFNKILPPADFWSFEKAVEIVHSSSFKPSLQKKLIAYLEDIAAKGTMDVSTGKCGKTVATYRKHLVSLNVNPITIAPKWGIEYLKNQMAHF